MLLVLLLLLLHLVRVPVHARVRGHPMLHVRHHSGGRGETCVDGGDAVAAEDLIELVERERAEHGEIGQAVLTLLVLLVVVVSVEEPLYSVERGDLSGQNCLHGDGRTRTERASETDVALTFLRKITPKTKKVICARDQSKNVWPACQRCIRGQSVPLNVVKSCARKGEIPLAL